EASSALSLTSAPATPTTRLAVETMPSFAPITPARSQLSRVAISPPWASLCGDWAFGGSVADLPSAVTSSLFAAEATSGWSVGMAMAVIATHYLDQGDRLRVDQKRQDEVVLLALMTVSTSALLNRPRSSIITR